MKWKRNNNPTRDLSAGALRFTSLRCANLHVRRAETICLHEVADGAVNQRRDILPAVRSARKTNERFGLEVLTAGDWLANRSTASGLFSCARNRECDEWLSRRPERDMRPRRRFIMSRVKLKPIDQQVIVITGASSGIGLATAKMASDSAPAASSFLRRWSVSVAWTLG